MNKAQHQRKGKTASGSSELLVEWFKDEPFCLVPRNEISPHSQTKRERNYYVKLVIDLPDYRSNRGPVWVRWYRRHRRVDRPSIVCGFPRPVSGVSDPWPEKGLMTKSTEYPSTLKQT